MSQVISWVNDSVIQWCFGGWCNRVFKILMKALWLVGMKMNLAF